LSTRPVIDADLAPSVGKGLESIIVAILLDPYSELAKHFPEFLTGLHQVLHSQRFVPAPVPTSPCSMAYPFDACVHSAADSLHPIAGLPIDLDDSAAVAEGTSQNPRQICPAGGTVLEDTRLRGRYDAYAVVYHAAKQMDVFAAS
jgi:hypothetical protein